MDGDRRDFLKRVGGLTAAAASPALAKSGEPRSGEPRPGDDEAEAFHHPSRAFAGDKLALELDGSFAGWLLSFEGGAAVADVVAEKLGPDRIQKKHLGQVKYEDITIQCGAGMSKGFFEWIRASLGPQLARKNGAIVGADFRHREHSRLEFLGAIVSEVGLPAVDVSSREAAKMTVKLSPEVARRKAGSGASLKFAVDVGAHRWRTSDFRLTVGGVEDSTSRANKIEAITIKQKVAENPVGEIRGLEPSGLEFPNLVVTVAASQAQSFYDWHEDFVIRGNCSDDREREGKLDYTDSQDRPLFSLSFHHLGVFKVAPDKAEAGGENVRRVKAEMYCEKIDFDYSAGWA
jgi:hypothetical protein